MRMYNKGIKLAMRERQLFERKEKRERERKKRIQRSVMRVYNLSQMNWRCGGQDDNDDDDDQGGGQPKQPDLFIKAGKTWTATTTKPTYAHNVLGAVVVAAAAAASHHSLTHSVNLKTVERNSEERTHNSHNCRKFYFSQTSKKKNWEWDEMWMEVEKDGKCVCPFVWIFILHVE